MVTEEAELVKVLIFCNHFVSNLFIKNKTKMLGIIYVPYYIKAHILGKRSESKLNK